LEHPNYFVEISPTGAYILENAIYSGASTLMKWYRSHFGHVEEAQAEEERRGVWEVIYGMAREAPVGNLGLLLIPFFGGSGAPYWNLDAKGALMGISQDHGRAHMVRAIIEGLAYETRRACELMELDLTDPVTSVITYGGSTRSPLWNQTFADILNKKTYVSSQSETTAVGAAMCAAAGAGFYPDVASAGKGMAQRMTEVSPDKDHAGFYDEFYREVYEGIYDGMEKRIAKGRALSVKHAEKHEK
jgi:xylulokinase